MTIYQIRDISPEDISAPGCFEIWRKLTDRLDIPVFPDDQHDAVEDFQQRSTEKCSKDCKRSSKGVN